MTILNPIKLTIKISCYTESGSQMTSWVPGVTDCFYVLKSGGEPRSRELNPNIVSILLDKWAAPIHKGKSTLINQIYEKVYSHTSSQTKMLIKIMRYLFTVIKIVKSLFQILTPVFTMTMKWSLPLPWCSVVAKLKRTFKVNLAVVSNIMKRRRLLTHSFHSLESAQRK